MHMLMSQESGPLLSVFNYFKNEIQKCINDLLDPCIVLIVYYSWWLFYMQITNAFLNYKTNKGDFDGLPWNGINSTTPCVCQRARNMHLWIRQQPLIPVAREVRII